VSAEQSASGLVYVISEGILKVHAIRNDESRFVKIGFTTGADAESRRRSLQTGNARPLVTFKLLEAPRGLSDEYELHRALKRYRGEGEWFDLPKPLIHRLNLKRVTSVDLFFAELPSELLADASTRVVRRVRDLDRARQVLGRAWVPSGA
jgi:hypothetical protein